MIMSTSSVGRVLKVILSAYNDTVASTQPDMNLNIDFGVFPNPAKDGVIEVGCKDIIRSITVYNTMGQVITEMKRTEGTNQRVVLPENSNGYYFIKVVSSSGIFFQKVVMIK